MNNNLDKYTLDFNNQEISQEELIKTFEIIHNHGLISKGELNRAISIVRNEYKSMKQIINESVTKST